MCKENCTEINLSSSVFNEMRDNFDAILKKALGNIVKGKSGQADINLKLTISATGENEGQLKPKFKHQVSSVMAIKERESGMVNPNAERRDGLRRGGGRIRPAPGKERTDHVVRHRGKGQRAAWQPGKRTLRARGYAG